MAICRLCALEMEPPPGFVDICYPCAKEVGIRPMPPPRRPARPCMRCNATKFVRAIPREYTATGSDHVFQRVAPMQLTAIPEVKGRLFFAGNEVSAPDIVTQGAGSVEVYACLSCGFIEWYCQDPEGIPIGPEFMTEIIETAPQEPYR